MGRAKGRLLAGCALAVIAAPMAAPTIAWAAADAAPAAEVSMIEELIVTAEKRQQNLQDVPVAISAFTDETRVKLGILTITDVANFTPGLSYSTQLDRPSIRGVGRLTNSFAVDNGVATYFDGAYTSSVQDASRRPLFIDRIEVLRGPQGTLYGRNSIGGAINTISRRPANTFEAEVRGFLQNYEYYGIEGTLSLPINDRIKLRLNAGKYDQGKGFFKNQATGQTEGNTDRQNADAHLTVEITDNLHSYTKLQLSDYDETYRFGGAFTPYTSGSLINPQPFPFNGGLVPNAAYGLVGPASINTVLVGAARTNPATKDHPRRFLADVRSNQRLDDHHNFLQELVWNGPGFDVKYVFNDQHYVYTLTQDADSTPVTSYVYPGTDQRITVGGAYSVYQEDRKWHSHEVNISSSNDSNFQWIVGAYDYNESYYQPVTTIYPGIPALATPSTVIAAPPPFFSPAPGVRVAPNPTNSAFFGASDGTGSSQAVFGQIDWKLFDQVKFTAGLRYTEDKKNVVESTRFLCVGNTSPFFCPLIVNSTDPRVNANRPPVVAVDVTTILAPGTNAGTAPGIVSDPVTDPATGLRSRRLKDNWDAVTGTAGLEWTPNDDTLVYFRYARGYKAGGFNAGGLVATPETDPEHVDSYELGLKAQPMKSLQVNAAAFLYNYTDIQVQLPFFERCIDPNDLSTCSRVNRFVNLPKAETIGFELEAIWRPTSQLQFLLSYGYLDSEVKDGKIGFGFINPDDPAALLPTAQRLNTICVRNAGVAAATPCVVGGAGSTGTFLLDNNFTFLPQYTQDLSGNPLPNTPKHKLALNANYTFELGEHGTLILSGNYTWKDKSYSDLFGTKLGRSPSYDQVDLRALWTDADNKYTVIAYVRNLFDDEGYEGYGASRISTGLATGAAPSAAGQTYFNSYGLTPPRVVGVELQYRF